MPPISSTAKADVKSPLGFGETDLRIIQGSVKPFNQNTMEDEFNTSF